MATIRVYRKSKVKNFSFLGAVGSTVGNTVGATMEGAGKVADSGLGQVGGAVAGYMLADSIVPGVGFLGKLAGGILGSKAVPAVGKGLKAGGRELQTY